jgi:hypothetical protein
MMSTEPINLENDISGLIDRLACGELDEATRTRVLAWLEANPWRWRACGLAFLEAQTWSQALGQWPRAHDHHRNIAQPAPVPASKEVPGRRRAARCAWGVAALLVAFGLGLASRDMVVVGRQPVERSLASQSSPASTFEASSGTHAPAANGGPESALSSEPVLAAVDVQSEAGFEPSSPIHISVVPASADVRDDTAHPAEIPEYVRRQWERRGYNVSFERRYLFARLPDGQQVAVPVEQLQLNPTLAQIN